MVSVAPQYKKPESVLVVIFSRFDKKVLMLQRKDDSTFWQSVTGSLEEGELPLETAIREVYEETGILIDGQKISLIDCKHSVVFELFENMKKRYAPGVTHNLEHWFLLPLDKVPEIKISEHLAFCWLDLEEAILKTKSPNNAEAINIFVRNF
ncbi:dihydroneopterin triphosphate diphosphatase [Thorsellia kenyensis]|uniref:Dihydroneopterin triphosphate diphosphatase n=1 Tax=Thorsellia kenyensis TaxID=1549888 RepID=A0ABV6C7Y5_9GAMM